MRYYAVVQGVSQPIPVEVERGDQCWTVTVAGKSRQLDAAILPHRALSMLIDGDSYTVEFDGEVPKLSAIIKNRAVRLELIDARHRLDSESKKETPSGKQVVTAPMGGKVVRVLVKLGDRVEEGQGLVVVEAMKMENELKSPRAGMVVELAAEEGSAVENNAKLVVIG
jgi:biotin carboxyl carrier protein